MYSSQRLPPFAAIRVFEACARHENFTRAAEELGMTQSAVSYQIKILEKRVGSPLFLRQSRRVELTEAGRILAMPTIDAFQRLRSGFAAVDAAAQKTLSINTSPTFALNWLSPRLSNFQVAHPGLAVRVAISCDETDFGRAEVDVAIRYGYGNWPGLTAHKLMASAFTPMLSRDLLDRIGVLAQPSDILIHKIIDPGDPYWACWLEHAGVDASALSDRIGSHLGSQSNEARAALEGQGVAMLTPAFFRTELEMGRLVQPFDLVASDRQAFWLVYPQTRKNERKLMAFRKWILSEMDQSGNSKIG
ncbi:transcriptional regulator GcvA [Ruegeria sp. 2205SS24-7]|uniref:transcriptional regulator GcvA n=1 Tax=Ruegeria discodermiae TaxID=3064389 RepID=UPI0027426499|nr:transcriptional regulator GcvA [Ruegeria sp. 2205SS24-7]MDP5218939.1 transcriptional regulator GcvA [Ruegeria sp. 2205SS24-7]